MHAPYGRLKVVLNISILAVLGAGIAALVSSRTPMSGTGDGTAAVKATLNGSRYAMRVSEPQARLRVEEAGMADWTRIEVAFPARAAVRGMGGMGVTLTFDPRKVDAGENTFEAGDLSGIRVDYVPVYGHDMSNARMLVYTTVEGTLDLEEWSTEIGGRIAGTLRNVVLEGGIDSASGFEVEEGKERILEIEEIAFDTALRDDLP